MLIVVCVGGWVGRWLCAGWTKSQSGFLRLCQYKASMVEELLDVKVSPGLQRDRYAAWGVRWSSVTLAIGSWSIRISMWEFTVTLLVFIINKFIFGNYSLH